MIIHTPEGYHIKWTYVENKLPENGKTCIVENNNGTIGVASYISGNWIFKGDVAPIIPLKWFYIHPYED